MGGFFSTTKCRTCKRELTAIKMMPDRPGDRICPAGHEIAKYDGSQWKRRNLEGDERERILIQVWEAGYITDGQLNFALKEMGLEPETDAPATPPPDTFMEEFKEVVGPSMEMIGNIVSSMPEAERAKFDQAKKDVGMHVGDIIDMIPDLLSSPEFQGALAIEIPESQLALPEGEITEPIEVPEIVNPPEVCPYVGKRGPCKGQQCTRKAGHKGKHKMK